MLFFIYSCLGFFVFVFLFLVLSLLMLRYLSALVPIDLLRYSGDVFAFSLFSFFAATMEIRIESVCLVVKNNTPVSIRSLDSAVLPQLLFPVWCCS
jgi:hypothetical protein